MASVYTSRFVALESATGQHSWTCPAGKRAVLKQVDLLNIGTATATAYIGVAGVDFAVASGLAQNARFQWSGLHAIYAGEKIGLTVAAGAVCALFSGYLFDDPVGP